MKERILEINLHVVWLFFRLLLRLKRFDDVVSDSSFLSSEFVRHNFLNVSQNGLVTNIDKNEHLPYWILSAMKYLARSKLAFRCFCRAISIALLCRSRHRYFVFCWHSVYSAVALRFQIRKNKPPFSFCPFFKVHILVPLFAGDLFSAQVLV